VEVYDGGAGNTKLSGYALGLYNDVGVLQTTVSFPMDLSTRSTGYAIVACPRGSLNVRNPAREQGNFPVLGVGTHRMLAHRVLASTCR
jgi:hypothetical protein